MGCSPSSKAMRFWFCATCPSTQFMQLPRNGGCTSVSACVSPSVWGLITYRFRANARINCSQSLARRSPHVGARVAQPVRNRRQRALVTAIRTVEVERLRENLLHAPVCIAADALAHEAQRLRRLRRAHAEDKRGDHARLMHI